MNCKLNENEKLNSILINLIDNIIIDNGKKNIWKTNWISSKRMIITLISITVGT